LVKNERQDDAGATRETGAVSEDAMNANQLKKNAGQKRRVLACVSVARVLLCRERLAVNVSAGRAVTSKCAEEERADAAPALVC
jgi:hypothetical protein